MKRMNETEIMALMSNSKTEDEWIENCEKVKKACNGYPSWWAMAILASGLLDRTREKYGW